MKQASKTVTRYAPLLSVYTYEAKHTSSKHTVFDTFSELVGTENGRLVQCKHTTHPTLSGFLIVLNA
jgi:hypothetical protein